MLEIEIHYYLVNTLQIYLSKLLALVCVSLQILVLCSWFKRAAMGIHTINNMETLVKKLKQSDVAKSEIISIIRHLCDGL